MNTANLQLQGVLTAMAEILRTIEAKGVLSHGEIHAALESAEREAWAGARQHESLSPANVEAACFPARYLRAALDGKAAGRDFAEVAIAVGQSKT